MKIYTTIPLPSLADPSGAFDAPTRKCPPDRGSQEWVTDSLAPVSPSNTSRYSTTPLSHSPKDIVFPPTPPPEGVSTPHSFSLPIEARPELPTVTAPQAIKTTKPPVNLGLATPPLTPEDSPISGSNLDFLTTIFPRCGLSAVAHAKAVSVSAPNLGTVFNGVVLSLPGQTKTVYIDGKNAENINLRESIVALLDLADEHLECNALVIAVPKSSPNIGDLLHSLMYVGGSIVSKPPFEVDPAYVLIGVEI